MELEPLSEFCHQVKIGEYNVTYVKLGSGSIPIFCFPGLLGTMRHSGVELLQSIANEDDGQKYSVYTWDPPGYFLSRPPLRKSEDVSIAAEVELSAQLIKHIGHSSWILMGWSAGGQAAIQFAIKYPELVKKLIVWGTWDLFEDDHLPVHLHHRDLKALDAEYLKDQIKKHGVSYDDFESNWHAWVDMIQREHFKQDKTQWIKRFEDMKCPTLIIAGSEDALGPLSQAQHLHEQIKSSRLEVIEGAPHWMQLTHHEDLYALIHDFL